MFGREKSIFGWMIIFIDIFITLAALVSIAIVLSDNQYRKNIFYIEPIYLVLLHFCNDIFKNCRINR